MNPPLPLFGSIQIGSTIQIKRSDGRVHLAKVVQLTPDSKSIGVEWSENGEVKGKEILVEAVFELNAELRATSDIEREAPPRPSSQIFTKFSPTQPGYLSPLPLSLSLSLISACRTVTGVPEPRLRPSSRSNSASTSRRPSSSQLVSQPTMSLPPPTGPFGQMIVDYRSKLTFTPLVNSPLHQRQFETKDLRICVAIRKRPMNKRELAKRENDVVTIPTRDQCLVHIPKTKVDLTKFLEHQTFK